MSSVELQESHYFYEYGGGWQYVSSSTSSMRGASIFNISNEQISWQNHDIYDLNDSSSLLYKTNGNPKLFDGYILIEWDGDTKGLIKSTSGINDKYENFYCVSNIDLGQLQKNIFGYVGGWVGYTDGDSYTYNNEIIGGTESDGSIVFSIFLASQPKTSIRYTTAPTELLPDKGLWFYSDDSMRTAWYAHRPSSHGTLDECSFWTGFTFGMVGNSLYTPTGITS
jgi:hypothetical protein